MVNSGSSPAWFTQLMFGDPLGLVMLIGLLVLFAVSRLALRVRWLIATAAHSQKR